MQFSWDWTQSYSSSKDLVEDFGGVPNFQFRGPGLYLTPTDTALVIPEHDGITNKNIWDTEQPSGTIWRVFVWNCPFKDTIFSAANRPPTRMDQR